MIRSTRYRPEYKISEKYIHIIFSESEKILPEIFGKIIQTLNVKF